MTVEAMPGDESQMDLGAHEPIMHIEDDGLAIKGYEIDGEFILDFDWAPNSRWSFLDDTDQFMDFVVNWLEQMTGKTMTADDIRSLRIDSAGHQASGQEPAGGEEAAPADQAEEA